MANGDGVLSGPGEAESAWDIVCHRVKAEFGSTDEMVVELPVKRPGWRMDDALSSNTFPPAYCEMECAESWERVSADFLDGDDILY